ncbi:hypothetical protein HanPI659440_Chr16g0654151 [Helianthus annuus]|nr:hypothetical protein HanPI659440_Chr16g0654151 [Helianthus annuus]
MRSKFCELTNRNVRAGFNIFSYIFSHLTAPSRYIYFPVFDKFVQHAGPGWT